MAIRSFSDRDTEALFRSGRSRRWTASANVATRKLDMLDAATDLADLREPPGNRLERLSGIVPASIPSVSMASGAYASYGRHLAQMRSRLWTIIRRGNHE